MNKKVIASALVALLLVTVPACSRSTSGSPDADSTAEGTQAVESGPTTPISAGGITVQVPSGWTVSNDDDADFLTVTPDDFDGMMQVGVTITPMSAFADADEAYEYWKTIDTSAGDEVSRRNQGDAEIRRYSVELEGGKSARGYAEVAISGDELISTYLLCAGDEYDDHAEEIEQILDTVAVVSPQKPNFSGSAATEPNVDTKVEAEAQVQEESATVSQQNALESAQSYIAIMGFSYSGLVDQLEFEGYNAEDATYAADNCGADWNAEALESARGYIDSMAFSYSGLVEQLEFEGFTADQAAYGADNCGADWYAEAAESAASYMDLTSFSRSGLIDQLVFEGFTQDQAEYGATSVGL